MKLLSVFLVLVAFAATSRSQTAEVISVNANLRGTPNSSGIVVDTLPQSTVVDVIQQRGPWFLVQSPEYVGWLHGDTIRLRSSGGYVTGPVVRSPDRSYSRPLPVISDRPPAVVYQAPGTLSTLDLTIGTETKPVAVTPSRSPIPKAAEETSTEPAIRPATVASTSPVAESSTATAKCKDGTLTYAIDRSGRCAGHGGVDVWYDGSPTSVSSPVNTGGSVRVKGYYRRDGTYVRPHTRRRP